MATVAGSQLLPFPWEKGILLYFPQGKPCHLQSPAPWLSDSYFAGGELSSHIFMGGKIQGWRSLLVPPCSFSPLSSSAFPAHTENVQPGESKLAGSAGVPLGACWWQELTTCTGQALQYVCNTSTDSKLVLATLEGSRQSHHYTIPVLYTPG